MSDLQTSRTTCLRADCMRLPWLPDRFACADCGTLAHAGLPPEWRNGRRSALKMRRGNPCGFESRFRHQGRSNAALWHPCGHVLQKVRSKLRHHPMDICLQNAPAIGRDMSSHVGIVGHRQCRVHYGVVGPENNVRNVSHHHSAKTHWAWFTGRNQDRSFKSRPQGFSTG